MIATYLLLSKPSSLPIKFDVHVSNKYKKDQHLSLRYRIAMTGNAFFGLLTDHIEIVQSIIICGLNQKFKIEGLKVYAYEKSYIGFGVHKHFFNRIMHARYPRLLSNNELSIDINFNIPRSKRYSQKSNIIFNAFIRPMMQSVNKRLDKKAKLSSKEKDNLRALIQNIGFIISFFMIPLATTAALYYSLNALLPFGINRKWAIETAYISFDILNEVHSEGLKARDETTSVISTRITKIVNEKIRNHFRQKPRDKFSQQISYFHES